MTAPDLHRWITVADACRRLGMRDRDARAWLRSRGLVQRVSLGGRVAARVYLAQLVEAMAQPLPAVPAVPARPRRPAAPPTPSWDDLLRRRG